MNPYPGLRPFRENESHLFFGRDGQTDEILARLAAKRFIGIVGVSGCGKSSLIHAGVFPALHGGLLPTGQRGWLILRMQPRNQPILNLARALIAGNAVVNADEQRIESIIDGMLRSDTHALTELLYARLVSDGSDAFALLLVVDQFEELFRFARSGSAGEAAHFVQLLLTLNTAARERGLPFYLAIAMRSDFLGDCAAFSGLAERINESQFLVPRLGLVEREAAIVRPAATQNQQLSRALVDRLLDDIGEDPDQLPVLQHALSRIWEVWEKSDPQDSEINLTHYSDPRVGGMKGAICRHAEEAFNPLTAEQRRLTAALFRCISERGEDGRSIRRPLPLSQIARIAGAPVEQLTPVVDVFRSQGRTFLTPAEGTPLESRSVIDISHESLIRNWPRLGEWARQEFGAVREWRRQREAAAAYVKRKQGHLGQLELQRVERWWQGISEDDPEAEQAILPSAAWMELNGGPGDDAEKTLQDLRRFTEESRSHLNFTKGIMFVLLGLVAALIVAVAIILKSQKSKAEEQAKQRFEVISNFSATSEQFTLDSAQGALATLGQREDELLRLLEKPSESDGAVIVLSLVGEVKKLRASAEKAADHIAKLREAMIAAAKVLADNKMIQQADSLAAHADDIRKSLNVRQEEHQVSKDAVAAIQWHLNKARASLRMTAGSPTPDADNLLVLKQALSTANEELAMLDPLKDAATMVFGVKTEDFSAVDDERKIVTQEREQLSARVNAASLPVVRTLETWTPSEAIQAQKAFSLKHSGRVMRMLFAPKTPQPLIVSATDDRTAALVFWDGTGNILRSVGTSNGLIDLTFNTEGTAFATASSGSTVRLYTGSISDTGLRPAPLPLSVKAFERHSDTVTDVEFSPKGDLVASSSADRSVRIFESATLQQKYVSLLPRTVTSVVFHRRSTAVASACDDGIVRLHLINEPDFLIRLIKFDAPARLPDFSPDGDFIVACSDDGTARVAGMDDTGRPLESRENVVFSHKVAVAQAAFQPRLLDSQPKHYAICTVAADGLVRFARSEDGKLWPEKMTALNPQHPGAALSLAWRADGTAFASVGGGEVLLWKMEAELPKPGLRIGGLPRETSRLGFSPDGRLLLVYGADSTAYLFRLPDPL